MKNSVGLVITLLGSVYYPPSVVVTEPQTPVTTSIHARTMPPETMVQEVFAYFNQVRSKSCKCGTKRYSAASPLVYNEKLANAAQKHASWMASSLKLTHSEPQRELANAGKRLTQAGYQWSVVAENVAAGQPTAREVVDAWIQSPGHCKNLMDPAVKEVGIGFTYTNSGTYHYYWVADFAAPRKF
ncbi:CAP domain-containing protein [Spirosoma sp. KNUC1025]|uniref:CAP domain-containing protein n=1 Tax=Spirosoma sp. KNUC1025 TaxID=2894082 RepID=UPI0038698924|nr:CAP domain-containing protein [Spirosoma sp. KNUC1025]